MLCDHSSSSLHLACCNQHHVPLALTHNSHVQDEPYRGYRGGDEHDMPHSSEHPGGYPVEHR